MQIKVPDVKWEFNRLFSIIHFIDISSLISLWSNCRTDIWSPITYSKVFSIINERKLEDNLPANLMFRSLSNYVKSVRKRKTNNIFGLQECWHIECHLHSISENKKLTSKKEFTVNDSFWMNVFNSFSKLKTPNHSLIPTWKREIRIISLIRMLLKHTYWLLLMF
jgi:hypothetical protein